MEDKMMELAGSLTKAQKGYLVKLSGWDWKDSRPSVSRALLKAGLLMEYRGSDYVIHSAVGKELKEFITRIESKEQAQ